MYRIWDLPALKNIFSLPRVDCALPDDIAFDETGSQAVVSLRPDAIDVVDLRTGESRMHIHRPSLGRNMFMAFHPRGAAILTGSQADSHFRSWDLQSLNRELTKLGLAVAELPAEKPNESSVERVSIVGLSDPSQDTFIGLLPEDSARQVLQTLEEAHRASPTASTANDLAWSLLMAPEKLRDSQRALELAELAVQQQHPVMSAARNTLAAAYYRNGEYAQAIQALSDNMAVTKDSDLPWDLYILSLSHAGLGEVHAAEHFFQLGQRWNRRKPDNAQRLKNSQVQELNALRAEAEAAITALRKRSEVVEEKRQ